MQIEKEKPSFDFEEFKTRAIADMKSGKALVGKDGVFTPLMKEFLEAALEGEITSHMSSCLEEPENENRRNGKSSKMIQSPMGCFELETPRDLGDAPRGGSNRLVLMGLDGRDDVALQAAPGTEMGRAHGRN